MYPVICKIGPLTVYSYGAMLVLAFAISLFLLMRREKKQGASQELILNLCLIILVSGIIGARILYVILNLEFYFNHPLEIVMLRHGGLAWFGGVIGGIISSLIYLKYKRVDTYKIFDLVVPYVALAQGIGRIGCFLNGCCYGKESPGPGIYFPIHKAILIPTQLYSSLALVAIFIILRIRQEQRHRRGEIFYTYLFLYSCWRFFIEFLRGDSEIFSFGLTIFQFFSAALFILALVMLARIRRQPMI